jgi:uncharacterized protein
MTGGLAIFVKTPGLSPLKTRLAATIGRERAESFYLLSCSAIEETVTAASLRVSLKPYWAVAETAGQDFKAWKNLKTLPQGEGDLGLRLSTVYDLLLQKYDAAFLIGADSPQISADILVAAFNALDRGDQPFVMGLAKDGGFYLFGGKVPVPASLWQEIPYSDSSTARILQERLAPLGSVTFLPAQLTDADTEADLSSMVNELKESPSLSPSQQKLLLSL